MSRQGLQLDRSGSTRIKPLSPKAIHAQSQARESLARMVIAGILLTIIGIGFVVSLIINDGNMKDILLVISSALGYLLGKSYREKEVE